MAVELLIGYKDESFKMAEKSAVEEAAFAGIQSMKKLVSLLSQSPMDCGAAADATVGKFKRVISLLDRTRTGHARFRKAPVTNSPSHRNEFSLPPPHLNRSNSLPKSNEQKESTPNVSFPASRSAANSFLSSLTGENDCAQLSPSMGFQISQSGRPPLSLKRKCSSAVEDTTGEHCGGASSSGRCHCSRRNKKSKLKRVVKVPAISARMADIPPDDFSWRKYGQKPIKGSPHPRGYYKCSSVRNCPARKHVEKSLEDSSILIVTYEAEHSHGRCVASDTTPLILESS